MLEGPAVLRGANGDTLEFSYRAGRRVGEARYTWSDGTVETSTYDENGEQVHLTNIM